MAKPSEAHVNVASRLLAHSRAQGVQPEDPVAAGRTYDELFRVLAPILGAAGFRALFARSVKLAQAEYPSLALPTLSGPPAADEDRLVRQVVSLLGELEPASGWQLATALFATFYALVATFIGESLVQQILKRAFPGVDESGPEVTK